MTWGRNHRVFRVDMQIVVRGRPGKSEQIEFARTPEEAVELARDATNRRFLSVEILAAEAVEIHADPHDVLRQQLVQSVAIEKPLEVVR